MGTLPRIRGPNVKNESVFRRARSVDTMRSQEELDGIETQNIKITTYGNNNIKKQKQSNGKALPNTALEDNEELIKLRNLDLEQKSIIKKLQENYRILEKQLLSKGDLVNYCKKIVDDEWNKKTSLLLDQIVREYLPLIESTVRDKLKEEFNLRNNVVYKRVTEFINDLSNINE